MSQRSTSLRQCHYPLADILQVHHVNGQGQDSGVVYSEMQGRENTSADLMALR